MNKKKSIKIITFSFVFICFISHSIIFSAGNFIDKNKPYNNHIFISNNTSHVLSPDSNVVVYSAHQNLNSRIVLINFNNQIISNYDYSNKIFLDLEVIDNEVYVLESLNKAVYKVDADNGDLELVIQDSFLVDPYSLAFDGNYFYVVGSNIRRYDTFGSFQGSASFGEIVYGAAFDGVFYWILNDNDQIKCYDIADWPLVSPGPLPTITPPSNNCRGLYFDGVYFWTAEYTSSSVGNIYQIDYLGNIITQLTEPYVKGWSACMISVPNIPPEKPTRPSGPEEGITGAKYIFSTSTIDPDDNGPLYYKWDWGDDSFSSWLGPYNSSESVNNSNAWSNGGIYEVRVKAKDIYNAESEWSNPLSINISYENNFNLIIGKISNLNSSSDYITFNADFVLWVVINPLEFIRYRSGEQISISYRYIGMLNNNFIFCITY